MEENRKTLKVYHGIIMLILSAVCVFFVSPILGANLGLYGTLLNEILLLVLAVALTAVVRGDFKQVFPIHKPKLSAVFGTILLWIGSFLAIMIITMIIAYFFPEEVIGVSQGLGMEFASLTFIISFVIVSISPAICEEAVFRGVVMHSFDNGKNKWIAIVVTGLIFGAFHGNIWRFVPTALLGIILGYIVYETDNMIYGALFHAINNAMPLLSIFAMKSMYSNEMFQSQMSTMTDNGIPLISIGMYVMYGAAIPLLLTIGNYLIHKGTKHAKNSLFAKEERMKLVVLLLISGAFLVVGFFIIIFSLLFDPSVLNSMMY
ncbi:putative uncharacterized protein [[Clostridium] nexile CAG:348]|mgnify:FL=1|nr:putative uncharacterized protein [[Clostridium] nexile CAG:348]